MLLSIANVGPDAPVTILYVRLSSEEQAAGNGLERQLSAVHGWCDRDGRKPDVLLQDIGLSAFAGTHIAKGHMGALIAAAEAGRICRGSLVVTENLDRLSRDNPFEAISILLGLLKKGVDVATAHDGARYTASGTGNQSMMMLVMSALHFGRSNSESETKSDRVGKAWRRKIERARSELLPHGARCPAWIRLGENGYEFFDRREEEVRRMFASAIAGRGRRQIVKDLIERKVEPWGRPTKKRPVAVWSDSYVQKILSGCEAYGTYRPSLSPKRGPKVHLEPIPNFYPAAVDPETAARARAAADLRKGSGGRKGAFLNLFQGLCVCGVCGRGMTLANKGRRSSGPKLVCNRAQLSDCAHRFRYDYAWLEPAVLFVIQGHADALLQASQRQEGTLARTLGERKAKLADVTARIERLARQMERVDDDDGRLSANFTALRGERRDLVDEIARLGMEEAATRSAVRERATHSMIGFYRRLNDVEPAERPLARNAVNQKLRSIVKRIAFDEGRVSVLLDGGTEGKIVAQRIVSRRPNPGQFVSSKGPDGRQLRRGPGR